MTVTGLMGGRQSWSQEYAEVLFACDQHKEVLVWCTYEGESSTGVKIPGSNSGFGGHLTSLYLLPLLSRVWPHSFATYGLLPCCGEDDSWLPESHPSNLMIPKAKGSPSNYMQQKNPGKELWLTQLEPWPEGWSPPNSQTLSRTHTSAEDGITALRSTAPPEPFGIGGGEGERKFLEGKRMPGSPKQQNIFDNKS